MLSILDQALALAATGTPVFPCRSTPDWKPTDKTPACLNGFKDATTDPERIRALFGVDAAKLIGVPTGAVSGFDILDFDPRHGGSEDAETAMKLPITKIHITQSGGKHYFFKSSGVKMPNSQGKVAPGVDVRGDGGYIIWWPCIGCEVYLDEDIAPWPATLDAVARAPKPRTKQESRIVKALAAPSADSALRVLADAVAIIEACLEGNRHSTIRDLCMTLASLINADLLDHDDARAAVLAAAEVCGAENMQNVENLFDSAVEKAEPAEINDGSELGALPPLAPGEEDDIEIDPNAWLDLLMRGKPTTDKTTGEELPGPLKANLYNAALYFRYHPEWLGRLRFNRFSTRVECDGKPMEDEQGEDATTVIQKYGIGITDKQAIIAMRIAARRRAYNPLQDYLRGVQWDGVARVDDWLIRYAGAPDTPLNRAFSSKTLISSVARGLNPGCKVDTVLILEGAQGLQKSGLFSVMAVCDEWFLDDIGDLGSKEAWAKMQGRSWIEFAELDTMNRNETATTKAFLSRRIDTFRSPFGHLDKDHPRQCIIGGTVNPGAQGYLKDETGARRFWPVPVGVGKPDGWKIDLDGLAADRDQLYAEAVARFDAGETWWLETAELETMQRVAADERSEEDPWHAVVAEYVAGKHVVSAADVLTKAIKMDVKEQQKRHLTAVGAILRRANWVKRSVRSGDTTSTRFVSPDYVKTGGRCNVINLRPDGPTLAEIGAIA